MRCMLCRKNVDKLTEHGICEECEKQFDFSDQPPYEPEQEEGSTGTQLKRILITSACAIGLILFMVWAIPFMMSFINMNG
ncbi:MAG: hypothetical protein ACOX6U_03495 [Oscillospiraceae bacterium]|jgi:hypothetical protein